MKWFATVLLILYLRKEQ